MAKKKMYCPKYRPNDPDKSVIKLESGLAPVVAKSILICPFLWQRTFAALKGNCSHVSTLNVALYFYSVSANVIQQRQTFYWAWSQMMHSWKPFTNVRKHTTKAQWWKCSPTQSKRDVWPSWRCSCITGPPLSDMRLSGWLIGNPLPEETVSHVLHWLICLSCADFLFCRQRNAVI